MPAFALPAVVLLGLLGVALLWFLLRRKKPKPWIQTAACTACGWRGQVSRYAGRCPSCNAPLGDRQGKVLR